MKSSILKGVVLSLIFSTLGLAWVIHSIGSTDQLSILTNLKVLTLISAIATLFTSFVFAALRLQLITNRFNYRLRFFYAIRAHILGIFSAAVTPGGSGSAPAIAMILNYHELELSKAWAVAIFLFSTDLLFYAWSLPLSLLILRSAKLLPATPAWTIVAILITTITAFLAYLITFKLKLLVPLSKYLLRGPLARFKKRTLRSIVKFVRANRRFEKTSIVWYISIQILTALSWFFFFLVLYIIAAGFAIKTSLLATQAWQLVIGAFSIAIPTPGGSGFFEAGMSPLLLKHGNDTAVPATILLYRLLTYYYVFVIGPLLGGYVLVNKLNKDKP